MCALHGVLSHVIPCRASCRTRSPKTRHMHHLIKIVTKRRRVSKSTGRSTEMISTKWGDTRSKDVLMRNKTASGEKRVVAAVVDRDRGTVMKYKWRQGCIDQQESEK
ncbi:hypothetical protein Ae201684P_019525 [Aphanomyces euteiches]|uniref:Uncharacterized protein n=1 Tax=Aphanomyces euteiches TaxID=100861 RepID=A0A6G0XDP4_9STRA|nr:hypothetical protein Ae201684_005871 [Aphanomyces euteiches]KAH9078438.1 hypothetical protein Ae201684P_019525 [Aphanomyces euteiches]